jgi:HTH-type transcriptional regulator / antitoxin HigA
MEALQYTVIKSKAQYKRYCKELTALLESGNESKHVADAVELLTLLVEQWDETNSTTPTLNPVELLQALMHEHKLKAIELAEKLQVGKSLVSDILNYKKGFSKELIRKLAGLFKLQQEAFNRVYELKGVAIRKTRLVKRKRKKVV